MNTETKVNKTEKKQLEKKTAAQKLKLKLPRQFKPDRPISDGPWKTYANRAIAREPHLTMKDLVPTEQDLALISKLAYRRDDLADNLATLIFEDRKVAQQLEQGLAQGIASLENPPKALLNFLDYYENMPDWTYMKTLQSNMATPAGQRFLHAKRSPPKTNPLLKAIEEGARLTTGFFVGAYYPAVGQSIVATGSVAKGSSRIIQTFKFFDDTSDVRDFMPFGKAVQAGAKVRLGHAFARKQIEKTGLWDKEYYGEVISDFDNMIFASGIIIGVNSTQPRHFKQYGVDPGKAMTYFLGAPKELLDLSPQEIKRFFLMAVVHLDGSPDTAAQVYNSFKTNEHYKAEKTIKDKFYKGLTYFFANFITRLVWGNDMADEIKLDKTYYGIPIAPIADYLGNRMGRGPSKPVTALVKVTRTLSAPIKIISKMRRSKKKNKDMPIPKSEAYRGSFGAFGTDDQKTSDVNKQRK